MAASISLLASPLRELSLWLPAAQFLGAQFLGAQGWTSVTCAAPPNAHAVRHVLDANLTGLPNDDELVLTSHGNVGAHVPILTAWRPVVGAVVVDAVLPPRRGDRRLAPPRPILT